ncbi:MAG: hypothetical protein KFE23_02410 [Candidatus Baumannia cicadellinicola]|nr:hypothetical protein [Candidatus Baumannia cicadellinicola]
MNNLETYGNKGTNELMYNKLFIKLTRMGYTLVILLHEKLNLNHRINKITTIYGIFNCKNTPSAVAGYPHGAPSAGKFIRK